MIHAIRARSPKTTIEVLTPDFLRKAGALEIVVAAKPDVFNHNLETVPSKYLKVRPGARYFHSIRLLQQVKEIDPTIFTKSGIMVGLGEERNEVLQLMDDLRSAEVDFLTIGQYLQPTKKHHPVIRFVTPDEFKAFETTAYAKGFHLVSATPLTRSSHHAGEDFAKLKAARLDALGTLSRAACSRILVIGSPGAGKSMLARRLAERFDLPLIHLDREYFSAGLGRCPARSNGAHRVADARAPARMGDGRQLFEHLRPARAARRGDRVARPAALACLARVIRRVVRY